MHFTELLARLEGCGVELTCDGEWATKARHLPDELEFEILDHLTSDRRTLKTCARVCRRWRAYSSPVLYERLSWPPCPYAWKDAFSPHIPNTRRCRCYHVMPVHRLYEDLSRSSYMCRAVQELRITGHCGSFNNVRAIVKLLPYLSSLELYDIGGTVVDDPVLEPAKQSVEALRLVGEHSSSEVALNALCLFAGVSRLLLDSFDLVFDPDPLNGRHIKQSPRRVRALVVEFDEDGFGSWELEEERNARERPLYSYLDPLALHELTLCNPFGPRMARIAGSWPNLFSFAYLLGEDRPSLAPQAVHTLRSLTLGIRMTILSDFESGRSIEEWVADGWARMLRDLAYIPVGNIDEVAVIFLPATGDSTEHDPANAFDAALRHRDWGSLERTLAQKFPRLKSFRMQTGSRGVGWPPDRHFLERCSQVLGNVAETMLSSRLSPILEIGTISDRYYSAWRFSHM